MIKGTIDTGLTYVCDRCGHESESQQSMVCFTECGPYGGPGICDECGKQLRALLADYLGPACMGIVQNLAAHWSKEQEQNGKPQREPGQEGEEKEPGEPADKPE